MKAVRGERVREARAWLDEGSWGWLRGVARFARGNIAFLLLITIGLLASLLSDVFLSPQNLVNILSAIAVIGIVSLGQTMLIISGNFDMSVASVLGFAGIVAVATQRFGLLPSILLALVTLLATIIWVARSSAAGVGTKRRPVPGSGWRWSEASSATWDAPSSPSPGGTGLP